MKQHAQLVFLIVVVYLNISFNLFSAVRTMVAVKFGVGVRVAVDLFRPGSESQSAPVKC